MKKLKQIIEALKNADDPAQEQIREFMFYSPKMPLRLHQEQLLAEAKCFSLKVFDRYFTGSELDFNCFSWGNGKHKVLLTHGWASKALDFYELIQELCMLEDVEIIAFDAPGNGSSVSEFSNLILYVDSIKSIVQQYALPNFFIGHSLGGMANAIAIQDLNIAPKLLISIAPLIRLKENFEQSMQSVGIKEADQQLFFQNFSAEFPVPADYFNLTNLYALKAGIHHFLAFDPEDHISPEAYLNQLLNLHPKIESQAYTGVGHYKILKSPELIADLFLKIKSGF